MGSFHRTPSDEKCCPNRVANATREQIENLFRKYDYRDPLGHPLILCIDFQDLLDRAAGKSSKSNEA